MLLLPLQNSAHQPLAAMNEQDPTQTPAGGVSPAASPPPASSPMSAAEEKNWTMFIHLAALLVVTGIPFANLIGPLVLWLIKKDQSPTIDAHGKEVVNFQITTSLALVVAFILAFLFIGFLLLPLVGVAIIVFAIIGGMKANQGVLYRYPFSLKLIK